MCGGPLVSGMSAAGGWSAGNGGRNGLLLEGL